MMEYKTSTRYAHLPYRLKSDRAIIRKASTRHMCDGPGCQRQIERDEHYVVYHYDGVSACRIYVHLDPCAILMRLAEPTEANR
jgi:hypothetical protein